jgi:predicted NUDIX family phosphoesterase
LKIILVIERKHLFPGLSPQGFLPAETIDLQARSGHMFFAERSFMEVNSHYKQLIPYLVLGRRRGGRARVLAYQRRTAHSERRLGGLWSIGFGGHIEPLDRADPTVAALGLLQAAALRELAEETGLTVGGGALRRVGCINSDREDVSSVHFGVVYLVDLDAQPDTDEELAAGVAAQAEPERTQWLGVDELAGCLEPGRAPHGGSFEDWSRIVIRGHFLSGGTAAARAG